MSTLWQKRRRSACRRRGASHRKLSACLLSFALSVLRLRLLKNKKRKKKKKKSNTEKKKKKCVKLPFFFLSTALDQKTMDFPRCRTAASVSSSSSPTLLPLLAVVARARGPGATRAVASRRRHVGASALPRTNRLLAALLTRRRRRMWTLPDDAAAIVGGVGVGGDGVVAAANANGTSTAVVVDDVFENQRFYGFGWQQPGPLERPVWSNAEGEPVLMGASPPSSTSSTSSPPPSSSNADATSSRSSPSSSSSSQQQQRQQPQQQRRGPWCVVVDETTDPDGWRYASVFKHLEYERQGGRASQRLGDLVRRRRWVRPGPVPAAAIDGSTAGTTGAAAVAGEEAALAAAETAAAASASFDAY